MADWPYKANSDALDSAIKADALLKELSREVLYKSFKELFQRYEQSEQYQQALATVITAEDNLKNLQAKKQGPFCQGILVWNAQKTKIAPVHASF